MHSKINYGPEPNNWRPFSRNGNHSGPQPKILGAILKIRGPWPPWPPPKWSLGLRYATSSCFLNKMMYFGRLFLSAMLIFFPLLRYFKSKFPFDQTKICKNEGSTFIYTYVYIYIFFALRDLWAFEHIHIYMRTLGGLCRRHYYITGSVENQHYFRF